MSMRATDAGYYGPEYGRRGDYSYEDFRESTRRTATRASGSYNYPYYAPRQPAGGRGVDVRVVDDGPPPPPRTVYIKERQQPDVHIYHERAARPQVRYTDQGGGDEPYGDERYDAPPPRGPRSERYYDDGGYDAPPPREERIAYRPQRPPSTRELVIRQANEEGPGIYEVNGEFFEAERAGNSWRVYRTDEPYDTRPARRIDGGATRVDSDRGPRSASEGKSEPSKTGSILRTVGRIAGWGLLGAGAFYALSGVVGGLTHGMDWGPIFGRTAMNWQQAVPAIIGGGVMAAGGGLLLKLTKKKPA